MIKIYLILSKTNILSTPLPNVPPLLYLNPFSIIKRAHDLLVACHITI